MLAKKVIALFVATIMSVSMLAGCGNSEKTNTGAAGGKEAELPDLEVWTTIVGSKGAEKDGIVYNWYKELFGVGLYAPYVEWNGGTTYQEQLNLRISAGEMPDMFLPVNGMEKDLILNGALLDLTDLIPEKAPHLWEAIPEEVWDVVKRNDPTGEGRIYVIPTVTTYAYEGAMVRQDWLDKLGMEMPTTQEAYVEMLRAFKTKDPNGNGKQDEIPTGGRAEARWMDHLFAMYGIAMFEGYPDWDIYNGELTYSAVTQNMRDALQFISGLYKEGLIDQETLLNNKAGWEGKVNSNQVGNYFHWLKLSANRTQKLKDGTGVVGEWAYMPIISAPGYEGYYTQKQIGSQFICCAYTEDEAKIEAMLRVLDGVFNPEYRDILTDGIEGYNWNYDENGTKVQVTSADLEHRFFKPYEIVMSKENDMASLDYDLTNTADPDMKNALQRAKQNVEEAEGKTIAGDGLPTVVYQDYPDIQNRTLFVEYASKIIAGEYPIEKFDEFVKLWYSSGGEEVTKRAREWYASVDK